MTARRFLSLVLFGLSLAFPSAAGAQSIGPAPLGPAPLGVGLNPDIATVHIAPPKGGAVMLYRDGKAHGWFLAPGFTEVAPGHVYGVMATRGQTVLFHAGVLLRAGLNEIAWSGADGTPAMSYTPALRPVYAHEHGHHHGHDHGSTLAPPPRERSIGSARYGQMIRKMRAEDSERERLAVLQAHARRYRFTRSQADGAVAEFRSKSYRRRAANALSGRVVEHRRHTS